MPHHHRYAKMGPTYAALRSETAYPAEGTEPVTTRPDRGVAVVEPAHRKGWCTHLFAWRPWKGHHHENNGASSVPPSKKAINGLPPASAEDEVNFP
jgi:hypothetical protein